jgi:hypothetical protein
VLRESGTTTFGVVLGGAWGIGWGADDRAKRLRASGTTKKGVVRGAASGVDGVPMIDRCAA